MKARIRSSNADRSLPRRARRTNLGQAATEFALVAVVGLFVLLVGIQYALIGEAALALNQAAYQAARYAAVNESVDQTALQSYLSSVASPTIAKNSGAYLSVSLSPTGTPRAFQESLSVTLSFDLCHSGLLVLGASGGSCGSFLGVPFPSTLTATETAMSE